MFIHLVLTDLQSSLFRIKILGFSQCFDRHSNTHKERATKEDTNNIANADIVFGNPMDTNSCKDPQSDLGFGRCFLAILSRTPFSTSFLIKC